MVSTFPLISNCSNPLCKLLGTVPNALTTTVTLMFHNLLVLWQGSSVIIIIFIIFDFFTTVLTCGLHRSPSGSKSDQLSRTSILADIVQCCSLCCSSFPRISSSLSFFFMLFGNLLKAPIIICIIVTFIFHTFLSSRTRSRYLFCFFFFFFFCFTLLLYFGLLCSTVDKFFSSCKLKVTCFSKLWIFVFCNYE